MHSWPPGRFRGERAGLHTTLPRPLVPVIAHGGPAGFVDDQFLHPALFVGVPTPDVVDVSTDALFVRVQQDGLGQRRVRVDVDALAGGDFAEPFGRDVDHGAGATDDDVPAAAGQRQRQRRLVDGRPTPYPEHMQTLRRRLGGGGGYDS